MQSARRTRQADRQIGGEIVLVVLCFLAFRLLSLLLLQYGGIFGSASDFDYYNAMAQQTDHGVWPYLSYWSEYPPIFPWLIVAVYRFAGLIGGSPSSSTFSHLLHIVLLTFDLGNLLLIYSLARRIYGQTVALRSAWVYATLFAPIFVWLGWFDPMPIFWMLLSLWFLARRSNGWAGFACGIGIVTKIFPGFVLLVALREAIGIRPSRRGVLAILSFAIPCTVAVALVCLPFAATNPLIFVTSVRSWFSRLPWESVWAIADGYYLFGIVPSLPARVAWPTYTTPPIASQALGAVSLLVLVGSIIGTYLTAWDERAETTDEVEERLNVSWAIGVLRRLPSEPIDLAVRLASAARPPRLRTLTAGLGVAGAAVPDDIAATLSATVTSGPVLELPGNHEATVAAAETLDERAFRLVAFAAALYAVVFLVTSGYSPQFMLWMVPFAVILLPSVEAFAWVTAFTVVVLVGERYLYYWYFPPDGLVLGGIVLVRSLLLIGLLGEILWQIGVPRAERWPRLRASFVIVTVIAFVAVSGLMLKTFADDGWGKAVALQPARLASSDLHQTTDQYDAILTFNVADYRWLGPWLGDRAYYLLDESRFVTPGQTERTMRTLALTHSAFVVVDRGPSTAAERAATDWLKHYGAVIYSKVDKTGTRTTRYEVVPDLEWPASPPSVQASTILASDVQLLGYSIDPKPAPGTHDLEITFVWKPLSHVGPIELVITPAGGNAVVGRIGSTYPPSEWTPGQIVVDQETIPANATTLTVAWRERITGRVLGETRIQVPASTP